MKKLNKPKREIQSRVWFLGRGFHPVPPTEYTDFKILYAHESDLRFVSQYGQVVKPSFSPRHRNPKNNHGHGTPYMRQYCDRECHILRALAFYGPRPTYVSKKGEIKPYHCHHLNGNLEDHCKANLLAWIHPEEHKIADARQKAMRKVVPNGNLVGFDYAVLRELQDPRTMSDADFENHMEYLRIMHECDFDPRIFNAARMHEFFAMPIPEFKKLMYSQKDDHPSGSPKFTIVDPDIIMDLDFKFHREF